MDLGLTGKVAVITGGSRGLGLAAAKALIAEGAHVVICARGEEQLQKSAKEIQVLAASAARVATVAADVSTEAGVTRVVDAAIKEFGRIDVVVNNAGIGRPRMVFNLEEDDWDEVVHIHLKGTFAVSRAACRHWRAQAKAGRGGGARLINTASGLLVAGGAGQSNYVAAKGGIAAFTEALATEMAPYGVTANAVMPAALTRLSGAGWRLPAAADEDLDARHVAELVCYLASPASGWISGQTFHVRGAVVEHVTGWQYGSALTRPGRPFSAVELADALPRLLDQDTASCKPPLLPPAEWAARRAGGRSTDQPK